MTNQNTGHINGLLIVMLILLAAVSLASLNMFLPSLSVMADDFGVSYNTMAWSISGYLLLTAIFQVLAGPLADRFGRRPVLIVCLCLFVAASVGCALSESWTAFLTLRIAQGAIITGMVLSRAIVCDIVGRQEAASILGYIAMAMSLAPLVGPMIGGFLGEVAGWRSNFWVYAGLGLSVLSLVWYRLPETGKRTEQSTKTFAVAYFKLLITPLFWGYTLIMSLSVGTFFIFLSGLPLVATQQFAMDQFQIGMAMGSITIGFLFGSFLSGKISTRYSPENMIMAGTIVASLGLMVSACVFSAGWVNPWTLLSGTIFVGCGNGLTMPNANASVMYVRRELAASASGLSGAAMAVVGAALSAVAGFIMNTYPNAPALVGLMFMATFLSMTIAIVLLLKTKYPVT